MATDPVSSPSHDPLASILKSAPEEAWITAVNTAGDIVRDILAPLTSTTAGLGRLIQAKFDGFIEIQRVLAADTLRRTNEKILAAKVPMKDGFNPAVVIPCMEESSQQMEQEMRDLWANLLARELTGGGIHPELPRILARLTTEDAKHLEKVSKYPPRSIAAITGGSVMRVFPIGPQRSPSLNEEVIRAAGLIQRDERGTRVTVLGTALLAAVAPFEVDESNQKK